MIFPLVSAASAFLAILANLPGPVFGFIEVAITFAVFVAVIKLVIPHG